MAAEFILFLFYIFISNQKEKTNLGANVMKYCSVAVGCSSSDVTPGALQVEGTASF